eukprot:2328332-Pyramimonas_sp.AAC.1
MKLIFTCWLHLRAPTMCKGPFQLSNHAHSSAGVCLTQQSTASACLRGWVSGRRQAMRVTAQSTSARVPRICILGGGALITRTELMFVFSALDSNSPWPSNGYRSISPTLNRPNCLKMHGPGSFFLVPRPRFDFSEIAMARIV